MRINSNGGSNQISNEPQQPSTSQVQNQPVVDGSARNAASTSQRNVSGALRTAEDGISANLRASLIRSSSSPNLANFTDNLGSSMQTARPAAATSTSVDRLVSSGSATPNAAIRDNTTTTSTIAINDDVNVTGVKVNVDIAHSYRGDLVVKLRSPEGKEVVLKNREGGSADNLVFEANPADFNGGVSKGNWTLVVEDKAAGDTGTLKSWSLAVTGEPKTQPPSTTITKTATPNAVINDNATVTSTINITDAGQVGSLKLSADIAHTYRGDLVVKVKSPSGKEVVLSNKAGGSADDLKLTDLDLTSQFAGEPLTGNWTFTVQDTAAQDTGVFKSWGLKIDKSGGTTPTPTPTPSGPTKLQVQGDAAFRTRVAADLAKFAPGTTVDSQGYVQRAATRQPGHDQGYALIDNVLNNSNLVTIGFVADNAYTQSQTGATVLNPRGDGTSTPGAGSQAQVFYDPALNIALPTLNADGTITDQPISSEVILAHELIHATHAQRGTIDRTQVNHTFTDGGKTYTENWRYEELRTTGFAGFRVGNEPTENSIRAELGFKPRATYLDRSSWTAGSGLTANNGLTAGNNDPFRPSPTVGGRPACNCGDCGSAGVQSGSNA